MPRRTALLALAAAGTALAAPAGAQAANACRAHADHAKVVAVSSKVLVYAKGPRFKYYVRACRFAAPHKTYRLPGQDGENTNVLYGFNLNGRYLGYAMIDEEEASPTWSSTVYSVDLRKRRTLVARLAGGAGAVDKTTMDVQELVVGAKGAIAWINDNVNLKEKLSVRTVVHGGKVKVLDHGNAIRRHSLALGADDKTVYWKHGGAAASARLP